MTTITLPDVEATAVVFSGFSRGRTYVVTADQIDTLAFWAKYGQDAQQISAKSAYLSDYGKRFFAFYVADCFDPPIAIIRADSWESGYEIFCDEFSDWMKIDDSDLLDYVECDSCQDKGKNLTLNSIGQECRKDGCLGHYYPTCNMSSSGVDIDTEAAQGHVITLLRVETA